MNYTMTENEAHIVSHAEFVQESIENAASTCLAADIGIAETLVDASFEVDIAVANAMAMNVAAHITLADAPMSHAALVALVADQPHAGMLDMALDFGGDQGLFQRVGGNDGRSLFEFSPEELEGLSYSAPELDPNAFVAVEALNAYVGAIHATNAGPLSMALASAQGVTEALRPVNDVMAWESEDDFLASDGAATAAQDVCRMLALPLVATVGPIVVDLLGKVGAISWNDLQYSLYTCSDCTGNAAINPYVLVNAVVAVLEAREVVLVEVAECGNRTVKLNDGQAV